MGEGRGSQAALQQQSESGTALGPGRRRYHWDPKVCWYRLAEIDGKRVKNGPLLDMDLGELGRQKQAELDSPETRPRGIRKPRLALGIRKPRNRPWGIRKQ
jgi:hypothetical protein